MALLRKILIWIIATSILLIIIEEFYNIRRHLSTENNLRYFEKIGITSVTYNETKLSKLTNPTSAKSSLETSTNNANQSALGGSRSKIDLDGALDKIENNQDRNPSKEMEAKASYDKEYEKLIHSPYIYNEELKARRLKVPVIEGPKKRIAVFVDPQHSSKGEFVSCRYKNCQIISDTNDADAVAYTASSIRDNIIPRSDRPEGQRWVMFTYDPAAKNYGLDRKDVGSNFNWTMTYQLDADITILFGQLRKQEPPLKDYDKIFESKTKHIAWFVSHCPTWSQREIYVSRMRKILEVDIFGKCGNLTCGVHHYGVNDSTLCMPMLTGDYKFYLSFENALCKDYITEKFFKMFVDVDVIPVVRGGFDYKRYLPSNIFIDASDFKSPEDLASYLQVLGQDKARYIQILREKNKWISVSEKSWYCAICEALHTTNQTDHYHKNLRYKFNGNPPNCWEPMDF